MPGCSQFWWIHVEACRGMWWRLPRFGSWSRARRWRSRFPLGFVHYMGDAGRADMSISSKPCYMPLDCLVSLRCIHLLVPSEVFGDLLTPRYICRHLHTLVLGCAVYNWNVFDLGCEIVSLSSTRWNSSSSMSYLCMPEFQDYFRVVCYHHSFIAYNLIHENHVVLSKQSGGSMLCHWCKIWTGRDQGSRFSRCKSVDFTILTFAACRVIRECLQSTRICFYVDPVLLKFYMSYMTLICLYTHKKSVWWC